MSSTNRYSDYDNWASMYDEAMGTDNYDMKIALLENLLLQRLPESAHIFDLCCGTGQVAKRLIEKGYRVTGLDGSEMMLSYARKNVADAKFILDDARFFKLPPTFDAVISTDRGLSHILSIEELKSVFKNVCTSLLTNGWFVFDLYLEEDGESLISGGSISYISDNHVMATRWSYDSDKKLGEADVARFELINGNWQRLDWNYSYRAYSPKLIQQTLEQLGFTEVNIYYINRDLGVDIGQESDWACVVCRKQTSTLRKS
ncbi:class I SAM-dependent DNA methyltransferase [Nostoc sp.]|uniref:class I SAM-dependent DNA methyltransferase n=1 Tax=Nostoc sp. TaxID=1180 RepID=UPI002FF87B2D